MVDNVTDDGRFMNIPNLKFNEPITLISNDKNTKK